MLVRKPSLFDIHKAVQYITSDQKEQDILLVEWIRGLKDRTFFSFVALENKEVVGFLTGFVTMRNKKVIFNLSKLQADTDEIKLALCDKVSRDIDPDMAMYTGTEEVFLQGIGFKTVSANMLWFKEVAEPVVEEVLIKQ